MQAWKTLSRKTILDHGVYLKIESHAVQLPSGRVILNWPWIVTPDFVNVVAITEAGAFLLFEQTKYSVEGTSLAPVGGYLQDGEEPLVAAQRELLEETGFTAAEWVELGRFPVDGNRGAGTAIFFLAGGARHVAARDADDLEEQKLLHLTRAEVEAALDEGRFKLLPWAGAIALALRALERPAKDAA